MKKAHADTENQKHKVHFAEISNFTLNGSKGFAAYNEDEEAFTCRTLKGGSTKISIQHGDGSSDDPTIDVVPKEIDKNDLGGGSLSIANGGTGKSSLAENRILLGNGQNGIQELAKPEKDLVLISTQGAPKFVKLQGEGLEIKVDPTNISLKTKEINLSVDGGITVTPPKPKFQLGETISLGTNPFTLSTSGGLYISGETDKTGKELIILHKQIHLGNSFGLKAQPITLALASGLTTTTPIVELGKELKLAASPITLKTIGGISISRSDAPASNLLNISLGETVTLTASPITLKTDTSISIKGGKEVKTGENQFHLGEAVTLETKPITLKTKSGLFISEGTSELQEKKVKLAEEITLGTKPITLNTQGGLYIGNIEDKKQKAELNLADEITLTTAKITIETRGGLAGGGSFTLGEKITLSSNEGLKWSNIKTNTALAINSGYIINVIKEKTIELTLPEDPRIGDIIKIAGNGAISDINKEGYWTIKLRNKEKIYFVKTTLKGDSNGILGGKHSADCVTLLCIKLDPTIEWIVTDSVGNLLTK